MEINRKARALLRWGTAISAGAIAGAAPADSSTDASRFPFRAIAPEQTVAGSIAGGPGTPAARAREPVAVNFPTPATGYLALRGGALLASHDGGHSWRRVNEGIRFDALDFVSSANGFGLSGRSLFRTLDGGRRWSRLHAFPKGHGFFGPAGEVISFVDRRHGWVVPANAKLYRTDDGGRSWTRLGFGCNGEVIGGVSFVTTRTGFAVCGGPPATIMQYRTYLRTHDDRNSWETTERRIFTGHVSGLEHLSERVGFEHASRLGIARLPSHRTLLFTDDAEGVVSMSWPDARRGFAVLSAAGLVRTNDGGRRWRRVHPRALPPPVGPLSFSSAERGIGAVLSLGIYTRAGAVLATADAGASWHSRGAAGRAHIAALARVSLSGVWAVATNRKGRLVLLRSDDDGHRWVGIRSFAGGGEAWLSFPSRRVGFLGDDRGHLYRTRDGGHTWRTLHYPAGAESGVFLSRTLGLAITDAELLATADGGSTWGPVPVRVPSLAFRTLGARDRQHIWIGGLDKTGDCSDRPCPGLLLRTSDGGRRWTLIRLPSAIGGTIDWPTPLIGYARGPYRTADGGRTWRYVIPAAKR